MELMGNSNDDKILVSVIVAVHNASKYLDECLTSLVNQTLKQIEIICVNDASIDNSLDILNDWASRYSQIRVIDSKVNLKPGGAWNLAIENSQGQYIGIVDSDDYVSLNMFATLVDNSLNYTADIVVGNCYATHGDEDIVMHNFQPEIDNLTSIKKSVLINGCRMWTNIFKKDLFLNYNLWYPERLVYEDIAVRAPLFMIADKIILCHNTSPLYYYRINNESVVRSYNNHHCWDRLITANMFLDHTKRLNLYETYKDEIEYSYWSLFLKTSMVYAIFSFSKYQYAKVKEIIGEYNEHKGVDDIKNNTYYKKDRSTHKYLCLILCCCPFVGYIIKWGQHLKHRFVRTKNKIQLFYHS